MRALAPRERQPTRMVGPRTRAAARMAAGSLRDGPKATRPTTMASDNYCMSVVQACADAETAIARARSLFGSSGSIDVPPVADVAAAALNTDPGHGFVKAVRTKRRAGGR
jgi:hypothetical protein